MSMSMPGRCVAPPFWAQAVNPKMELYVLYFTESFHFRPCIIFRRRQKVPTMFLCPVRMPTNVPIVGNDRKLPLYDPTYALADLSVEIRWLDPRPISCALSDAPAKQKSKSKSKLAGPEAAPLGRKQTKCRISPDQLLYKMKDTKSRFNSIQSSYAAAFVIQLSKPFQMEYLSNALSQV